MELSKFTKNNLILKCQSLGIVKCKSKNKKELIEIIESFTEKNKPLQIISHYITENIKYTMVDLFCGTGAFSYAFDKTMKVKTIFANDILDSAECIFNLNNNFRLTKQNLLDMNDEDIPPSNILTAGFPCQPFSIAGMQKGFDDERSNVFWKLLSIIKKNNPNIVILENVKNLQSHDNGNTFKIIIDKLESLNYFIKYSILNTCKITGIPHNRERIFIICFKDKNMYDTFNFQFREIKPQPILNFMEAEVSNKYYYNSKSKIYDELQKNITKHVSTNTIYQYRRYYVRENKNSVCPTLTANMGSGGHNVPIILDDNGIRKLTPRECFNLQGFPHDYKLPNISDNKLYCLAGNAVTIPLIELIASNLLKSG